MLRLVLIVAVNFVKSLSTVFALSLTLLFVVLQRSNLSAALVRPNMGGWRRSSGPPFA